MLKLYANPCTVNSRKVFWALEELERPYTVHLIDLTTQEQKQPWFVALNPNGRLPVLDDEGLILFESNAILLHLGETSGRTALLPQERRERSLVYQWLSWQASDLAAAFIQPFLMRFNAIFGQPFDAAAHARCLETAAPLLALLDTHLAGRRFVVGDSLTLADIALAESVAMAEDAAIDVKPFRNVLAWLEHLFERPAFRKTRFHGEAFVQAVRYFSQAARTGA